jgi:hypothetical protein
VLSRGVKLLGQANIEPEQRHGDAENTVVHGVKPRFWKHVDSPVTRLTSPGRDLKAKRQKAGYSYGNIKVFRVFGLFQD